MTNIPTAKDFLHQHLYEGKTFGSVHVENLLKDFAKLHIEEALKEVFKNSTCSNKPKYLGDINYQIDEESIINAYPLTKIQ